MTDETPEEVSLKLRVQTNLREAKMIRNALIDYARNPDTSKEDAEAAWKLLTVFSKRILGA